MAKVIKLDDSQLSKLRNCLMTGKFDVEIIPEVAAYFKENIEAVKNALKLPAYEITIPQILISLITRCLQDKDNNFYLTDQLDYHLKLWAREYSYHLFEPSWKNAASGGEFITISRTIRGDNGERTSIIERVVLNPYIRHPEIFDSRGQRHPPVSRGFAYGQPTWTQ